MGLYKVETTPEQDEQIAKLKFILGEKTASNIFRKLLKLRIDWENGNESKNN